MTERSNVQGASSGSPLDVLPEDLSWAAGGHASDVALTAIADGQADIVLPSVRGHVERCTVCTTQLGHVALLSIHVGAELSMRAAHGARARPTFPWLAVAAGLVVAVLGSIPAIVDSRASVSTSLARNIAMFVRQTSALRRVVEPGSPVSLALTYGTAALLLTLGLVLARTVSKAQKEVSR